VGVGREFIVGKELVQNGQRWRMRCEAGKQGKFESGKSGLGRD
jgi:hypothetical protein